MAQWPALANLLSGRPEFAGADFSYGDNYIFEKGQEIRTRKPGNAVTWLTAGFSHHVTTVAQQIYAFSEQLTVEQLKKNR